jgi:hypothetical protein
MDHQPSHAVMATLQRLKNALPCYPESVYLDALSDATPSQVRAAIRRACGGGKID